MPLASIIQVDQVQSMANRYDERVQQLQRPMSPLSKSYMGGGNRPRGSQSASKDSAAV